jgi:hypothetical protein
VLSQFRCQTAPPEPVFSFLKKQSLSLDGLTEVCLPFVLKLLVRRRERRREEKKDGGGAEPPSPNGGVISNCPQPHEG